MSAASRSTSSTSSASKKRTRTRSGCLTCRRDAKVRCDQQRPACLRCTRLGLQCRWEEKHVTLKEQRRLEAEKWAAAPPNIRPAQKNAAPDKPPSHCNDQIAVIGPLTLGLELGTTPQVITYDGTSTSLDEDIFDSISASLTDDFTDPFLYLSPTSDMIFGAEIIYASLPSLVPLTRVDHQALDYFQKEVIFGFGSKSPAWSTHAILLGSGSQQPMVLHLLLAASLTEIGWQHPGLSGMINEAEEHYRLGGSLLLEAIRSTDEPDHLAMLASFWFLYLHQRRRCHKQAIAYRELSSMMRDHVQKYRLDRILSSEEPALADSPKSTELASPQRASLLARLTTWLFWTDAQSCFQGEGGSMARLLLRSSSPPQSRSVLDIYERSRATLELHWGQRYPDSELADDLKNGGALELIHHTWVIVQEINEATEFGPLDPEKSREIKAKMEGFRTKFPFSSVFRLAESGATVRDRLMANSDWAVCNYYALCIYHFRCSPDAVAGTEVGVGSESDGIEHVVAALVILIQKTLAACEKGQIDRLQWPLFWAGIETTDPVYREWILMKLTNPGLQAALEIVLLEQSGAGRIGINRLRRICQEKCAGSPNSMPGW